MEATDFECTRQSGGVRTCFGVLQRVLSDDSGNSAICPDCGNRYNLPGLAAHVETHGYAEDRRPKAAASVTVEGGFVVIDGVRYQAVEDDFDLIIVDPTIDIAFDRSGAAQADDDQADDEDTDPEV